MIKILTSNFIYIPLLNNISFIPLNILNRPLCKRTGQIMSKIICYCIAIIIIRRIIHTFIVICFCHQRLNDHYFTPLYSLHLDHTEAFR